MGLRRFAVDWENLWPVRRCIWCGRRFFNRSFWRWSSIRHGLPEHCGDGCWLEEKKLVDAFVAMDGG